jgi:hypothetical protein
LMHRHDPAAITVKEASANPVVSDSSLAFHLVCQEASCSFCSASVTLSGNHLMVFSSNLNGSQKRFSAMDDPFIGLGVFGRWSGLSPPSSVA